MLAGVAVVGPDDVAEHERGTAIGRVEFGETGQTRSALPGKDGKHPEQRQERKDGPGALLDHQRNDERDGREREIDSVNPELAELLA